jgi:GTP-binding protein HflX
VTIRVYVIQAELKQQPTDVVRNADTKLAEAISLVQAIPVELIGAEVITLRQTHPATLFGSGAVQRLAEDLETNQVELLFINQALSPIQQRNLERALKVKVIDRQGLILEIFGARAKTREGKLQVELAQLQYQRSRLVKAWSHLERQRGGLGKTGGPGETQKELDRRMIDTKIKRLELDLSKVVKNRGVQRQARQDVPFPVVALVGYTNAGKSTLFNRLTNSDVLSADMLFATLDPTMRILALPNGQKVILSDTVGFIADLPTSLVAAFRATLEEVLEADLIWHVQDVSHAEHTAQADDVLHTLKQLDLPKDKTVWQVWNKCDLLNADDQNYWQAKQDKNLGFGVSAITGQGVDNLLAATAQFFAKTHKFYTVQVPISAGHALAWCYQMGHVLQRTDNEDNIVLQVQMAPNVWAQGLQKFPLYLFEQEKTHA